MSTHDTEPPSAPPTLPELEPIPRGKAAVHVAGAMLDVLSALHRLEAVCAAVARQLDAMADEGRTP